MAIEMQNKLVELRSKWSDEGFTDPFRVRMGINTGFVMLEILEVLSV